MEALFFLTFLIGCCWSGLWFTIQAEHKAAEPIENVVTITLYLVGMMASAAGACLSAYLVLDALQGV